MIKVSHSLDSRKAVKTPQIKNLIGRVRTNKLAARAIEALLNNFVKSFAKQHLEITTFDLQLEHTNVNLSFPIFNAALRIKV